MLQSMKRLSVVLFPVLVYQLANFSAQVIDTMMTGRYNATHLASVSIGGNFVMPFLTFMMGVLSFLTPTVGQHVGAKQYDKVSSDVRQFMYLAFGLVGFAVVVGIGVIYPLIHRMSVSPEIQQRAWQYVMCLSIGIPPLLLFSTLRAFVDGLGFTRISMAFMLLLVPLNIIFNYLLIYGKMGLPALGGVGAGLGTALAHWVVLGIVIVIVRVYPPVATYDVFRFEKCQWHKMGQFLRGGVPIGLAIFAEVAVFATVGLLMSRYDATTIAAHQSAMNVATFVYGFPLSISTALTIVISQSIGSQDFHGAKVYARSGILLSLAIACVTMCVLFFQRATIARMYGTDATFIQRTIHFVGYALFFQFSDAIASPIQGILRGYKDTTMPFLIGLFSYWCVGIVVGMSLAQWTAIGPASFWIGLIIGLFVASLLLTWRLRWKEQQVACHLSA